ncbi:MAG TPA: enolase C-terminal domain-like protein [Actinomycetes bacterium]|nr:enolase C-terminal domain-like protein [Actinomycetes bacterium]
MAEAAVDRLDTAAYTVPTEAPESDGTLTWTETTVVVVEARAGDRTGLGFTYATGACATLVRDVVEAAVVGRDPLDVPGAWEAMVRLVRNLGRPGIASTAIAAVDTALWDLKARLLELPLHRLLGAVREQVPVYGSGGFTSLSDGELVEQLGGWVGQGIPRVKMKVGAGWGGRAGDDLRRVALVRERLGDGVELYVDANGGYGRKQAVRVGRRLAELGVSWFEEPVSSDDLEGLREVRDHCDADVAAGEYGYDLPYFRRMVAAGAVDCLQADVSRCAGITEWLRVAAVAAAAGLEVSGHCAQSLHAHPAAAVPNLRHLEYFHDHARTDRLLFDGVLDPGGGCLRPDPCRPGMGLELKRADAERWRRR